MSEVKEGQGICRKLFQFNGFVAEGFRGPEPDCSLRAFSARFRRYVGNALDARKRLLAKSMTTLSDKSKKKSAVGEIICGVGILIASEFLLLMNVEPVASNFYLLAWWAYILAIDGIIYLIRGNSLIISRTREFLVMLPLSVAFWLLFEIINLRLENWYYANVTPLVGIRWPGYFFAYATVLPGIFQTAELLKCLGLFRRISIKPRTFSPASFPVFYTVGIIFLILPLVVPRYCFPLIWLAFIFLLEPLNYIHRAPSLLRDWEEGQPQMFYLLLTAGLICGGLWEFWNFWAHTKWIYTVPFFDDLKLFEMPLAGFLGFPPFAVECYVMYNFVSLFRGRRNWMQVLPANASPHGLSRRLVIGGWCMMLIFYVFAFRALDRYTVNSYIATIEDIPSLPLETVAMLRGLGIQSISQFLDSCAQESTCDYLHEQTQLSEEVFRELVEKLRLASLKWMGVHNAALLQKAGVTTVEELSRRSPQALHTTLKSQKNASQKIPTPAVLKLWIRAAKDETRK